MATIVVIEDEEPIRDMAVQLLQRAFPEDTVRDAADYNGAVSVLAKAKEADPTGNIVILSDFNYSGMGDEGRPNKNGFGGPDILKHATENYPDAAFAFMSGRHDTIISVITSRGLHIDESHILPKPFTRKKAVDIIHLLKQQFAAPARPNDAMPESTLPPRATAGE